MLATPEDLASLLQQDLDRATATMLLELSTSQVQRAAGGQRIVDATDTALIDITELDQWIDLPQYPVRSVTSVTLDGTVITDWKLVNQRLWRAVGWLTSWAQPSQAAVLNAHGHPTGSQYLQLGRNSALSLAVVGYGTPGGATSEAIDDYRVTYAEAAARMEMSEFMAAAIRAQYGTTAYQTTHR
jgi:hypothetical protein